MFTPFRGDYISKFTLHQGIFPIFFTETVYATHGFGSGSEEIHVEDNTFEIWGYLGDGSVPAFRLRDIAYVLVGGEGFANDPYRTIILGVDGENSPATTIAFMIIQDIDDIYFPLHDLQNLLGFEFRYGDLEWDNRPGINIRIKPERAVALPQNSREFVDLLVRASGSWVHETYFNSDVIDESVVWPVGFSIFPYGFDDSVSGYEHIAPIDNLIAWNMWEYYSLAMRTLNDGLVELTIDPTGLVRSNALDFAGRPYHEAINSAARFFDHRIIVNASDSEINSLTYYIGDSAHNMVRFFCRWRNWPAPIADRYYAEPSDCGGIKLRYVMPPWSIWQHEDKELKIYRSTIEGDRGTLISSFDNLDFYDRILYEFIDTTAQLGNVYYYTLVLASENFWRDREIWFSNSTQMTVDVNEVFGHSPYTPHEEIETHDESPPEENERIETEEELFSPHGSRWWIAIVFAAALLFALVYAFSKKKK